MKFKILLIKIYHLPIKIMCQDFKVLHKLIYNNKKNQIWLFKEMLLIKKLKIY
jgi:hypothetical protein